MNRASSDRRHASPWSRIASPRPASRSRRHTVSPSWTGVMSSERHLAAAAAAGRGIVADAVWFEGRCNWIGASSGTVGRYQALGPTLYKGTAGVGLFLAHLYR